MFKVSEEAGAQSSPCLDGQEYGASPSAIPPLPELQGTKRQETQEECMTFPFLLREEKEKSLQLT